MNGPTAAVAPPPYTSPNRIPSSETFGNHGYLFVVGFICTIIFLIIFTYVSCKCTESGSPPPPTTAATINGSDDNFIRLSRGLDHDILITLPTFVYSETTRAHKIDRTLTDADNGSGCAICLEDYKPADVVRLVPECGHLFHVKCIDAWLKTHSTCPVCRNFAAGIDLTEVSAL